MPVYQLQQYFFWVLAPSVETNDPHISYYYDFTQSIEEYRIVFEALNCEWKWQPVTIQNFRAIIETIAHSANGKIPFVLNLCDGDDVNDVPGVSVIHELEKKQLIYSGANAYFYDITTSKIPMKKAFDQYGVPNAAWVVINENLEQVFEKLKPPVLIKPAVSGGSMGVSVFNVVHNFLELTERVNKLSAGYRGWNLMVDGLLAEEFIIGKEYSTLITGNYRHPENCKVYIPIQRVFHASLPKEEQFLSFDRLWEIYEDEAAMPDDGYLYEYAVVEDAATILKLKQLTIDAFISCKGVGYARLDFRESEETGELFCLEINAQCGLSADEDYTSIGAILRFSEYSFTKLVEEIIAETIRNREEEILLPEELSTLKK
jgi:D-alanine-D-alanine ligase